MSIQSKDSLISFLFLGFTLLGSFSVLAQEMSFGDTESYILGDLKVTGLKSYNEQTVKTYTGLRVGQLIEIPGEEISGIIKKLWNLELFSDVAFYYNDIKGDSIFLELNIKERPTLNQVTFYGIKKSKADELLKDADLKTGKKITESLIANTKNYIQNTYKEKGYLNAKATIATSADSSGVNVQNMVINVNKGPKVKIGEIVFEGREKLKTKVLERALKNTKSKKIYRFWKKSRYKKEDFDEDLKSLVDAYAEKGYRDARVIKDSVYPISDELIGIHLKLQEGNQYYFGDIDFVGNTVYSDRELNQ